MTSSQIWDYLCIHTPIIISIGSAAWVWFTKRDIEQLKAGLALKVSQEVERQKGEIASRQKKEETVLQIASGMESRLHERDVAALQDCQKSVAKFFTVCTEFIRSASPNYGDDDSTARLWSEASSTYLYLCPLIALAREPARGGLNSAAAEMFQTIQDAHKALDEDEALLNHEGPRAKLVEQNLRCIQQLDLWATELRNHQMRSVIAATQKLLSVGGASLGTVQPPLLEAIKGH